MSVLNSERNSVCSPVSPIEVRLGVAILVPPFEVYFGVGPGFAVQRGLRCCQSRAVVRELVLQFGVVVFRCSASGVNLGFSSRG